MLVIINAMKSITRSKGRNILIGIIALVIAASCCVALAIRNAAGEAEDAGKSLVNITGTISVDRQKLMESAQSTMNSTTNGRPDMSGLRDLLAQYPDLTLDQLQTYANSGYVQNFYYSGSLSLDATGDLQAYSASGGMDTTSNASGNSGNRGGGFGGQGMAVIGGSVFSMAIGDFTVTGYSSEDAMTKFISGTSQITDGAMFDVGSPDMNCLISSDLAAYNGLSVGDSITLSNPNATDETYTLTISGIYTDSSSGSNDNGPRFSTAQDPANLICISYGALQSIINNSASVATTSTDDNGDTTSSALTSQLSSTYVFASEDDYNNFQTELYAKGLSDNYILSSSDISNYESSLVPLQNLSGFATTLLFIVLAIGAVILIVINIFNIRERKYEVGVLTAIGIKKGKVALQFVTELLCVTLISIIIGAAVGAAVSVPVANNLLASQINSMQSQYQNQNANFGRMNGNGGPGGGAFMQAVPGGQSGAVTQYATRGGQMMNIFGGGVSNVNYLDKINATINISILGELILIGIVLTVISSLAGIIFVLRYEPLKILANRA